ncbi:GNAT family N-acetyltransferase, partial [bacterium]|nr:GNAT family N-acetyltransferase [candidate division CSSED10-310 bacterium]
TDALIAAKGTLARLAKETIAELDERLPPFWSHGNPVDVLGDCRSKRYARAVEAVLPDAGVDAVLAILTPQSMTNPRATAMAVAELVEKTGKPILAAWLGGQSMQEGIKILSEAGIPSYRTPEQAVRAFMTLVAYSRNLGALYETPRDIPVTFTLDRKKTRAQFASLIVQSSRALSEEVSKTILASYGIQVTQPFPAADRDTAAAVAERLGYPVVLKIDSPDITHKSDLGGVELNLEDDRMVRSAFDRIVAGVREGLPGALVRGVTVQPMLRATQGLEMILGMKKDPTFGAVIMAGLGGTTAEVFNDITLGLPPLNERLARRMLESLRAWPLLRGYRGRPGVNLDRLIETIMRFSYLAADYPEIMELDINPLLVTTDRAIALDARIIIDPELVDKHIKPYSHLALHPYPEELVRQGTLKDGSTVLLRPIKPEDEPLWMEMLGSCSRESIYSRFRYFFHWESHEVASRYCFIDYDREIAIVAEVVLNGERSLVGVGRLIADPDHEVVEYAVLVTDAWQNKGLGGVLTDCCMAIAERWGLRRVVAQTTTDNPRMIALFRRRGFEVIINPLDEIVEVAREMKT